MSKVLDITLNARALLVWTQSFIEPLWIGKNKYCVKNSSLLANAVQEMQFTVSKCFALMSDALSSTPSLAHDKGQLSLTTEVLADVRLG